MSSLLSLMKTPASAAPSRFAIAILCGKNYRSISRGLELFCGGSVTATRLRKGDKTQPDRSEPPPTEGGNVNYINDYRDNLTDKGYRRMTFSGFKDGQGWTATSK